MPNVSGLIDNEKSFDLCKLMTQNLKTTTLLITRICLIRYDAELYSTFFFLTQCGEGAVEINQNKALGGFMNNMFVLPFQ